MQGIHTRIFETDWPGRTIRVVQSEMVRYKLQLRLQPGWVGRHAGQAASQLTTQHYHDHGI